MRKAFVLASFTLPFAAAFAPPPLAEAAVQDPEPVVVEIDACLCESILKIEDYVGDTIPWTLSWTPQDDIQHGRCKITHCLTGGAPRPCKGKFKVKVTWPGISTPPCDGVAQVAYRKEGEWWFTVMGQLDFAQAFVPIKNVGANEVECKIAAVAGQAPTEEANSTLSYIRMDCVTEGNLLHERYVKLRETCKPCAAVEEDD